MTKKKQTKKHNGKNKKALPKKNRGQAATAFVSFPEEEEVIFNILTKLPLKSLLRFRCVCKYWCRIMDNAFFVDAHFKCSLTRPSSSQILISFSNFSGSKHYFYSSSLEGGKATLLLSLPGCNKGTNIPCQCYISESVHGLVCFYNGNKIYICNPNTQNIRTLPASSRYPQLDSSTIIPYSRYYFGFNSSAKEYKVLHIFGIRPTTNKIKVYHMQCEVFTIRTHSSEEIALSAHILSWRNIPQVPPYPYIFKGQGVCVNGVIYWIGMKSPDQDILVAFDLASETFHSSPLPNSYPSKSSLTQVGGCLALFDYGDGNTGSVELWVLKKDYHNLLWFKESVVSSQNHRLRSTACLGEILLTPSTVPHQYDLIPCYHNNKAVKTIDVVGLPPWMHDFHAAQNINFSITKHVESFMPIPQIRLQFRELVVHL